MASPTATSQFQHLDESWQALLHRDILQESASCLAETYSTTEDEKAAIELGCVCFSKKTICKDVPLPSDPKVKEVFDRVVHTAIREAAKDMISNRNFKLENETPLYEVRKKTIAENKDSEKRFVTVFKKLVAETEKRFSVLRNQIELLTEWSKDPSRVFTDPLLPI